MSNLDTLPSFQCQHGKSNHCSVNETPLTHAADPAKYVEPQRVGRRLAVTFLPPSGATRMGPSKS